MFKRPCPPALQGDRLTTICPTVPGISTSQSPSALEASFLKCVFEGTHGFVWFVQLSNFAYLICFTIMTPRKTDNALVNSRVIEDHPCVMNRI